MEQRRVERPVARIILWFAAALAAIVAAGAASVMLSGWLLGGVELANGTMQNAAERAALGDYFGGVSAVFSGLALIFLVVALLFQQHDLRLQRQELALQREELAASRQELRRSAEADLRGLHVQLTQMAMDDPSLAEVWNDYPGESPEVTRQHLFANLLYSHFVLHYQWGSFSLEELTVLARTLLASPAFRRYWVITRPAKRIIPVDTPEGRLFHAFDRAFEETPSHAGGEVPPQAPPPGH